MMSPSEKPLVQEAEKEEWAWPFQITFDRNHIATVIKFSLTKGRDDPFLAAAGDLLHEKSRPDKIEWVASSSEPGTVLNKTVRRPLQRIPSQITSDHFGFPIFPALCL